MSAVERLQKGNSNNLIENKYIDMVLQEGQERIYEEQERILSSRVASKNDLLRQILAQRSYTITDGRLSMTHNIAQRFVDMNKHAKLKIHNKIIWSEYSRMIKKLRYGFSESVKQLIAQELKMDING